MGERIYSEIFRVLNRNNSYTSVTLALTRNKHGISKPSCLLHQGKTFQTK